MESNPTLTFLSGIPPNEEPITDLTIDKVRLVCTVGTYNGSVIYPDNVVDPSFTNLGNGQYNIGYFQHSNFKAEIGSGYYYYVKVQRKIGDDWTDQPQFGQFWIGYGVEIVEYLVGVEAALRAAADALLMPKSGGTFTGHIAAAFIDNPGAEMRIGTNQGRVFIGNAAGGSPITYGGMLFANSLTTKAWVQTEITNRIATILEGNYQESINVVRVIPEGVPVAGQVYANLSTALIYGRGLVDVNKPLTVLIAGLNDDTGGVNLDFIEYDEVNHYYACALDYIHFRGLHANSKILSDGNIATPGQQFKAGALGRIVMEDLYFYFNNDGNDATIENIIFRNCKFESLGGHVEFVNCQFEGLCTFISSTPNEFTFTGCYGPVFGKSEITAATPYETMTRKFNPRMISKEFNFSEPITSDTAGNGTFFVNSDNGDKLTYKDLDGNLTVIQNPGAIWIDGAIKGSLAANNSIFLDVDNGNKLSYKNGSGTVYTIDITALI